MKLRIEIQLGVVELKKIAYEFFSEERKDKSEEKWNFEYYIILSIRLCKCVDNRPIEGLFVIKNYRHAEWKMQNEEYGIKNLMKYF